LEELAADPSKAGVLDVRTARIVAAKALGVFAASLYRLFEAEDLSDADPGRSSAWRDGHAGGARALPEVDDVLRVEEVAEILGKPRRWIIRNAADLPFVTRVTRKHYICSRSALQRWIASRPRPSRRV
jgi:predicted DNA-binding transcriptional regulator AlpA